MALSFYGFRRFTEDVDSLVTHEGLAEIHRCLKDRGYSFLFPGSKHLRDSESGVRVKFMVTGDYPGDGKPKPVAFPDPDHASIVLDGIRVLDLPRLIELKLASVISNPGRLTGLADVEKSICTLDLPESFADLLSPFVQERFREMWATIHSNPSEP